MIEEGPTRALSELSPGDAGTFVRVSDSDPAMLRYLSERGIFPGDEFEVVRREPFGGPLTVRFAGEEHVLGGALTEAMRADLAG
jgi:DtxR family Mn-dependent transcriptional regulator